MAAECDFSRLPDYTEQSSYESRPEALTVKEMSPDEQPRERALRYGVASLSNSDLFALILRTGLPGCPVTVLCRDLMKMHSNLFLNLERAPREQLMLIDGIGEAKALQIEAVMEIVRRYNRETVGERIQIRCSKDIYDLMRHEIGNLPHEEIWAIYLNRANRVIARCRISSGSSTASVFDTKKVVRTALLAHAEGVIICHNHPSGNCRPSGPDDAITRKLKAACESLELTFLDHLILTSDSFFSYSDSTSIIR